MRSQMIARIRRLIRSGLYIGDLIPIEKENKNTIHDKYWPTGSVQISKWSFMKFSTELVNDTVMKHTITYSIECPDASSPGALHCRPK